MQKNNLTQLDKLEDLPSLKDGWGRVVHRLVLGDGSNLASIKANGLIFNRQAAGCQAEQKGGSYNRPSEMASIYNQELFWDSLKKDDFSCFNDARYADVQVVFDLPLSELAVYQMWGKFIHGKIDAKYLVGCIPNYNGANQALKLACKEVEKARQVSIKNPPSSAPANDIKQLSGDLIKRISNFEARVADQCDELQSGFAE